MSNTTLTTGRAARARAGFAVTLGGIACALVATAASRRPEGYVGDECLAHLSRDMDDLVPLLVLALALIAIGVARLAMPARAGTAVTITGAAAMLATAPATQAIGDAAWSIFLIPGALMVLGGMILENALAANRAGSVPRPISITFAIATLLLLGFNTEDARVLFLLPMAFAAAMMGLAALTAASDTRRA